MVIVPRHGILASNTCFSQWSIGERAHVVLVAALDYKYMTRCSHGLHLARLALCSFMILPLDCSPASLRCALACLGSGKSEQAQAIHT